MSSGSNESLASRLSSRPQEKPIEDKQTDHGITAILNNFVQELDTVKLDLSKELYDIYISATPANRDEMDKRLVEYVVCQ